MRHLLNTLFVLTPESYLMLDGENIVLKIKRIHLNDFHFIFLKIL